MAKTDEVPGPMARLVKRLRTERKWTQEKLAEESGLERVEVSNLETGRLKGKSARVVLGLSAAFQIKPERLAKMLAKEAERS